MIFKDGNVFMHCIFNLPWRGFHLCKGAPNHNLNLLTTQAAGSTAAIHGGISTTKHDHFLTNFMSMLESNACKPFYSDMYVFTGFFAAWQNQIASSWSTCTYKYRIVSLFQNFVHTGYIGIEMSMNSHIQNIPNFLVQYIIR